MALISLDLARQHLRIEHAPDDDPESLVLPVYIAAAEQFACEYLSRAVFATVADLDTAAANGTAGNKPIVVTDAIRAAMLLILGHLYVNREDTVIGISAVELPNGSKVLLNPYRVGMGA